MVDVDVNCQFSADPQPESTGLIWGLAATRRSVYIHPMNRVNSREDFSHDDSITNIVVAIIIIIIIIIRIPDDLTGGAYSAPPDPLAVFEGAYFWGEGGGGICRPNVKLLPTLQWELPSSVFVCFMFYYLARRN